MKWMKNLERTKGGVKARSVWRTLLMYLAKNFRGNRKLRRCQKKIKMWSEKGSKQSES